jgi:hypothetical protein
MASLTRDDIRAVLGSASDALAAEILASGASKEELTEAYAWIMNDEALVNAGRRLPSGRVGRLVEILQAVEEESPADAPE